MRIWRWRLSWLRLGSDVRSGGGSRSNLLMIQHLEHVGNVSKGVRASCRSRGNNHLFRRRPVSVGIRWWRIVLVLLGTSSTVTCLFVVVVCPPNVELSKQVLSMSVGQSVLEVVLVHGDQPHPVHVPHV